MLLTGISHHPDLVELALLFATLYRHHLTRSSPGAGLTPDTLTTEPGTREQDFDAPDHPDPGVVSTDEATKDVTVAAVLPPLSISINAPVLLADGQYVSGRPAASLCLVGCG